MNAPRAATITTAAAVLAGALAFALYRSTLLPGFDLGDTASFQAMAGAWALTPRDGYPLYFAIGHLFVWATGAEPAHALNLASAFQAAVACGLIVILVNELVESRAIAAATALLFAGSYTFWSQAVIAEVYALHVVFVAATWLLLLRWERRPSTARLAVFFAVYALGFGNHLTMILLAPAYAFFLIASAPGGWRTLLAPRIVALALLCACLGAAQYAWNMQALWTGAHAPTGVGDAVARFWFDATKTDWRDTMIMRVPGSMLGDRLRMYWFDLTQQFGPGVPAVALLGAGALFRAHRRRGVLLIAIYLTTVVFAYSYNVGDAHVFYLPSHLCVAVAFAAGLAALAEAATRIPALSGGNARRATVTAIVLMAIGYGALRVYRDYPALDRSDDRRPAAAVTAMTDGLDDRRAILLADLNWQLQNGLTYFAKHVRTDVAYARTADVLLYAPVLIHDNVAAGRTVAATERARNALTAAYGPLFATEVDTRVPLTHLRDLVRDLPPGTRYALSLLKPAREFEVEPEAVSETVRMLTGGALTDMPPGDYAAIAGRTGEPPAIAAGSSDPFRRTTWIAGVPVEVRMESWLASDTIRRMGFGHVIAARRHTLILERGVSFAAFDDSGRPLRLGYAYGIYAPAARYLVRMPRDIVEP